MTSEARCEVCGRPWDGGTLLPREVRCGGCHLEVVALMAEVIERDKDGVDTGKRWSLAQACAIAFQNHFNREQAALRALVRLRLERNAAGKHAADGVRDIPDTFTDDKNNTFSKEDFVARAQKRLDAMDAEDAAREAGLK